MNAGASAGRRSLTGVATFIVVAAAWYVLTTLTHTISPGRFPSPGESWDALAIPAAQAINLNGEQLDALPVLELADAIGQKRRQLRHAFTEGR